MSKKRIAKIIIFLLVSSLIQAFTLNCFYKTSGLLSGGFTGIGLMLNKLTNDAIPLSLFLLLVNIPLALLAYFNVGKKFTVLTFANVFLTSLFLTIVPAEQLLDDILLNAIVGGLLYGVAIGIALEGGASTGGTDFIALFISVKKQVSPGNYMLILSGSIILASAIFFNLEIAVYTILASFVCSAIINSIHVRYQRVTLAIITSKGEEVADTLIKSGEHGITIMPAIGAYSKDNKSFLYTVVSTYEVNDIKDIIFDIDKHAFINVTSSQKIFGSFVPVKYD